MLYFIPAWYKQNEWCENEQYWYVRRARTEFDDTVKQIQLFHRSCAYPYQILLLSFTPNFRHFLHRQSVYHAPYWSCFDAIQEIRRKKAMVLSFHNLNWPEHIEFVYTPFAVVALLKGEKYAQIDFGEDGNPIQVDMYEQGQICRRNIYDDRGFVSSTIRYEDGKPVYQDYLNEEGALKIRKYMADGHVEVNPSHCNYLLRYAGEEHLRAFSRMRYDSMEQVVFEVFTAWLSMTERGDIFCAAMHGLHARLLKESLKGRKLILSFFADRYDVAAHGEAVELLNAANYIITDSKTNSERIRQAVGQPLPNMTDITPYDSRVDFGISQQMNVQKILVPVDGIEEEVFEELVCYLAEYMVGNDNAMVYLFTRQADYGRKKMLLQKTRAYLEKAGLEAEWAREQNEGTVAENDLDETEEVPVRFFVEQCVDELSVSKCMREQRIVVDMRKITDLYLRITCISMAIPQILYNASQYMEHGKNGLLLTDMKELPGALEFYLDGLANWNEAMVYSYELGQQFTTAKLIEDWKGVIDSIG
jgi:accessory secretory protein Asp1